MDNFSNLISNISIILSIISAIIAFSVYRLNMRQVSGDIIYRIIERFETPHMRDLRRTIYSLERDKFLEWDNETQRKVDMWGAELDVVSTVLVQEANVIAFFQLYGDVILRSIYQVAPYGNHQRITRGRQFLLPLEKFGGQILNIWKKSVKKREYPSVIGLPNRPTISLSYDTFMTDRDCQTFLQRRG